MIKSLFTNENSLIIRMGIIKKYFIYFLIRNYAAYEIYYCLIYIIIT